jgi:hypothetical protein
MTYLDQLQSDINRQGLPPLVHLDTDKHDANWINLAISEYRGPYRDLIRILATLRIHRLLQTLEP